MSALSSVPIETIECDLAGLGVCGCVRMSKEFGLYHVAAVRSVELSFWRALGSVVEGFQVVPLALAIVTVA